MEKQTKVNTDDINNLVSVENIENLEEVKADENKDISTNELD